MNIPALIYAGDTVQWSEVATPLYSSATWTRTVSLRHATDADALNVVGVAAAGGGWDFTITAAQSAALGAGTVYWQDYMSSGATRNTVGNGTMTVKANLVAATGAYDGRTQAQIDLEAVRAAMRAIVTGGATQEYSIGNRSLKKMSMPDLIALETKLKADVARDARADRLAKGMNSGRSVFVRFGG